MKTHSPLFSTKGAATVLVICIAILMTAAIAAFMAYVNTSARTEVRSNNRLKATYAAEYAIENMYGALSTWLNTNRPNVPTLAQTTTLANLSNAPTSVFTSAGGYDFAANILVPVENGLAVASHTGLSQSTNTYRFVATAEVTYKVPTMATPVRAGLQREFIYTITPIFQFAIFEDRDLELFPGATFTVGGRVHSNNSLYYGTGATLTFNSFVTSVSGAHNNHSPDDPRTSTHTGPVVYNGGQPFITMREDPPATDTSVANANTSGGARELIEIPNTSAASDPNAGERMYTTAGLKVLTNSTGANVLSANNINVAANSRVFLTADGTIIPAADPLYPVLNGAFASGSVLDYRENFPAGGTSVATTDVDVGTLRTLVQSGAIPTTIPAAATWPAGAPAALANKAIDSTIRGKALWNSQLYVADVTDTSSHRAGVRLLNGTSLPAGGLTVSTENAAYVVGNYNTGGNPAVNTGLTTDANTVAGYSEPGAILADAITVLSQNWTTGGYNAVSGLAGRTPTATTINAAIIAGIVPSSNPGAYSGGAENFLRLLENWSGVRLTYYGSLIMLYDSARSNSIWRDTGNYYNAPSRNWYFDTNFNDPNKLPKGTPVTRSLRRGQWMQLK